MTTTPRATGRVLLAAGVAALGLLAVAPSQAQAQAQARVLQPAEKTAFDVRALQSHLMVTALNCQQEDQYNAFVTRYRGELGAAYRTVAATYRRAGGQRALDAYITNMANAQSQQAISQGSLFCRESAPLFQAALAAPNNPTALAALATEHNLPNPHGFGDAPVRQAAATRSTQPRQPARPAARTQQPRPQQARPASSAAPTRTASAAPTRPATTAQR